MISGVGSLSNLKPKISLKKIRKATIEVRDDN